MHQFPWMSPYEAFNNNPVFFVDPLGLKGKDPSEKGSNGPNEGGVLEIRV